MGLSAGQQRDLGGREAPTGGNAAGCESSGGTAVSLEIRRWFDERGFEEVAFVAPPGETFRVGVHRLVAEPRAFERGARLFRFVR